ncbi:MAG: hypothetical protein RMJ30_03850 [Nitrososphaerota archaeon]|nr:hypothetical protein [Nitrososphaerota archaeon]
MTETKRVISKQGYIALGIVSAVVSLFLFPPFSGGISILCGIQLFKKYDEGLGLAIIIYVLP